MNKKRNRSLQRKIKKDQDWTPWFGNGVFRTRPRPVIQKQMKYGHKKPEPVYTELIDNMNKLFNKKLKKLEDGKAKRQFNRNKKKLKILSEKLDKNKPS